MDGRRSHRRLLLTACMKLGGSLAGLRARNAAFRGTERAPRHARHWPVAVACRSESKEQPVPEQTNKPITHDLRDRGQDPRGIANALIRLGIENEQPRDPLKSSN